MCQTSSVGFQFSTHALDYFISFTHPCHFIVSSPLTATHFHLKRNLNLFPELHIFFLHFFWIPLGFPPGPSNLTGLRGPSLAVYSHAVCAVFPPLDLPQVSSSQTHSFTHNPAYTSSPFPSTA